MSTRASFTSFFRNHRVIGIAVAATAWGLLAACNQNPTFTPGSGTTFGTMETPEGTQYTIQTDAAGAPMRIQSSDGGGFSVDDEGRITRYTSPQGDSFDFTYLSGNGVTVDYDLAGQGNGTTTVDLSALGNLFKTKPPASDKVDICTAISQLCDRILALVEKFRPILVEQGFRIARPKVPEFIPDDVVRAGVEAEVDSALKTITDFCYWWKLVVLVDNPCK